MNSMFTNQIFLKRSWLHCGLLTLLLLTALGCQQQKRQDPTLAEEHPANLSTIEASASDQETSVFNLKPGEATVPDSPKAGDATAKVIYVCPMHAQIRSDKPGQCPICKMTLKPEHVSSREGNHEGH